GAFAATVSYGQEMPWLSFVLLPAALLALRGCPMCWTVGLFETLSAKFTRHSPRTRYVCAGGTCTRVPSGHPAPDVSA
ncbi:MAG TPA: hypothetical protein VFX59_04085, partial [Polyangiales bacterium]|nr:hypothetical protein [Polyangiales bacterium]